MRFANSSVLVSRLKWRLGTSQLLYADYFFNYGVPVQCCAHKAQTVKREDLKKFLQMTQYLLPFVHNNRVIQSGS